MRPAKTGPGPAADSQYPCFLCAEQEIRAPVELVRQTKALGRLPVVNFAAGGVATPADAALMMQLVRGQQPHEAARSLPLQANH